MTTNINYAANPLHGLSLKNLLIELVDYYGFDILYAYLNINCFKTNPSIESSLKFLNKTTWAKENLEAFYMYKYKNLPRASEEQQALAPRDRIVPDDQHPGEPAQLSFQDAQRLNEDRARKAALFDQNKHARSNSIRTSRSETNRQHQQSPSTSGQADSDQQGLKGKVDPWAKTRGK
jgi:uncharacterized protein (DUF2132 family)